MNRQKVAFLGPKGTYSHQAALQQFPDETKYELIPAVSIPTCFESVLIDPQIEYAVIPFENSTNGQVVFTYDLIRDVLNQNHNDENNQFINDYNNRKYPPLNIIGEQYVKIEHCLIVADSDDLKNFDGIQFENLYSHPQVWGQVSEYLNKPDFKTKFKNIIDCKSTAEAMVKCKEDKERGVHSLAIGSAAGAKVNKCEIVEEGINNMKGNTTRFLTFVKRKDNEKQLSSLLLNSESLHKSNEDKMVMLTFTTLKDGPGSLVEVLKIFQNFNINMTSISSRPIGQQSGKWQYIFYVEYEYIEGLNWRDEILKEIDDRCLTWALWGIFPRDPGYYS